MTESSYEDLMDSHSEEGLKSCAMEISYILQ